MAWMTSQLKPWRSMAPGAKFSTSTSHTSISLRKIARPLSVLVLMVMLRLLQLSMVKYRLSTSGRSRSCWRVISPRPGSSTLMTLGAQPGQGLGRRRPHLDVGHVQHTDSVQGLSHAFPLGYDRIKSRTSSETRPSCSSWGRWPACSTIAICEPAIRLPNSWA